MGGTSMVVLTGGTGAMGGTSATGGASAAGGSSAGGTDSGTAAAAGSGDGVPQCGELAGLGTCGGTHVEAKLRTVNMLLVIDKSGSMEDQPDGFDQQKWSAMKSALDTALGKVKTQMNLGLVLYPYSGTSPILLDGCELEGNCCALPAEGAGVLVGIQPGTVAVDQINAALSQTGPGGGTPTAAALAAALDYFTNGEGAALDGDNYVLLATDGGPNCNDKLFCEENECTTNLDNHCKTGNCCEDTSAHFQCLDDDAVNDQLTALTQAGVSTFVVGIPGTEAYAKYLDGFANLGGVPAPSGDHAYYAVSADAGVEGLAGVFESITTQLLHSCDIELPEVPSNLKQVNVAIDCTVVPRNTDDTISGWDYDQEPTPSYVVVHGPACESLQKTGAQRVDVVFGCPTVR
jgi:hypothetical protein